MISARIRYKEMQICFCSWEIVFAATKWFINFTFFSNPSWRATKAIAPCPLSLPWCLFICSSSKRLFSHRGALFSRGESFCSLKVLNLGVQILEVCWNGSIQTFGNLPTPWVADFKKLLNLGTVSSALERYITEQGCFVSKESNSNFLHHADFKMSHPSEMIWFVSLNLALKRTWYQAFPWQHTKHG